MPYPTLPDGWDESTDTQRTNYMTAAFLVLFWRCGGAQLKPLEKRSFKWNKKPGQSGPSGSGTVA